MSLALAANRNWSENTVLPAAKGFLGPAPTFPTQDYETLLNGNSTFIWSILTRKKNQFYAKFCSSSLSLVICHFLRVLLSRGRGKYTENMVVPPSKETQYSGHLWDAQLYSQRCDAFQTASWARACKAKPDTVSKTRSWSLEIGRQAFPGNCLGLPWLKWILQNRLLRLILSTCTWRSGVWSPSKEGRLLF